MKAPANTPFWLDCIRKYCEELWKEVMHLVGLRSGWFRRLYRSDHISHYDSHPVYKQPCPGLLLHTPNPRHRPHELPPLRPTHHPATGSNHSPTPRPTPPKEQTSTKPTPLQNTAPALPDTDRKQTNRISEFWYPEGRIVQGRSSVKSTAGESAFVE